VLQIGTQTPHEFFRQECFISLENQFADSLAFKIIPILLPGTDGRADNRGEDFVPKDMHYISESSSKDRMPHNQLMPAFVGDDGLKREIP
jgi:hypothetical protein